MSVRTLQKTTPVFLAILIAIIFLTINIASAQESIEPITSTTTASSTEATTTTEEVIPVIEPKPAERQAALQIQAQKRITNLAANMSNRMDNTVYRMKNVVSRLKSRLAILESENINTTAARAELAAAETNIDMANASLQTIDAEVAAFVGSENPKEAWLSVRKTFTLIRDALLAAHTGLQKTLDLTKSATTAPTPETASSTGTTTEVSE